MENLKLGSILAIVIATIAIILILWNLRINSRSIVITPGPTILVNGECEEDQECIDGRNCFGGRCTQLVATENQIVVPPVIVTPPPPPSPPSGAPTCCDYTPASIGVITVTDATTFSGFGATCSWFLSDPFELTVVANPTSPPEGETIYLASFARSDFPGDGNTGFHVLTASEVESTDGSGGWIDSRTGVQCGFNYLYEVRLIACAVPVQNAVASNLRESVTEDYYSVDVNWGALTDADEYAVSVRLSCTHSVGPQIYAHQQFAGGRITAPTTSATFDFLVAGNDNFPYVIEEVRVYGYRQCAIDNGSFSQTIANFSGI